MFASDAPGAAGRAAALFLILMALIARLALVVALGLLLVVARDAALAAAVLRLHGREVRPGMLELLARRRLGDAEGEAARRQQMRIGEGLLRRVGRRHAHRERLAARQLAGGRELEVREARPLHLLAEGDGDVDLALVAGEAAAHLVVVRAVEGDVARKAVLAEDARREARGSVPDKAGGLKREDLERRLGRRDDERVVVVFAAKARLVRDRHAVGPGRLEGEGAGGVALRLGDAALVEHELLDDR